MKGLDTIRDSMHEAANILDAALNTPECSEWDYLLVAVPRGRDMTTISMLSNVPVEVLPDFVHFIHGAYVQARLKSRVIDDTASEAKPS